MRDLQKPHSEKGSQKAISSGFLYWGVDPTMEWVRACSDPFYAVMRDGLASFNDRWAKLHPHIKDRPYHYVSLGPGTGHKDHAILADLLTKNKATCYVPVDMSAEMLNRLNLHPEPIRSLRMPAGQVLPVQLDFAVQDNAMELRRLLRALLGNGPILFSLLGNTLANFDDDVDLLQRLVQQLVEPDDLFLLEVATTQQATPELANDAAEEYKGTGRFADFVTSALHTYTDLTVNTKNLDFLGEVEENRALRLRVLYRNRGPDNLKMVLPGWNTADFDVNDTILLDVTRKYTLTGIDSLLSAAKLTVVGEFPWSKRQDVRRRDRGFGVRMLLLKTTHHKGREPFPPLLSTK